MARRKKPSRGLALRGVIVIPDHPGKTPLLFAADPEAAQRALADIKDLELANPPRDAQNG